MTKKKGAGKGGCLRSRAMAILCVLGLVYVAGIVSHRQQIWPIPQVAAVYRSVVPAEDDGPKGRWYYFRGDDRRNTTAFAGPTVPYAAGYEPPPEADWVPVHIPEKTAPGYRLLVVGPEAETLLVDTTGQVKHRWLRSHEVIWPGVKSDEHLAGGLRDSTLLPGGDILALYIAYGVVRLDKDSNVVWKRDFVAHHDLEVTPDGRVFVLEFAWEVHEDQFGPEKVQVDYVTELDLDGNVRGRTSLLECILDSNFTNVAARMPSHEDITHGNSIRWLDGRLADRIPAFAKDNLMVSFRSIDSLAVFDLAKKQMVWEATGLWMGQHDPHVLANGNVLVFDNQGIKPFSRLIEFDPVTREVDWKYVGNESNGFCSNVLGATRRLANGNTLVTESVAGRVFEITPDGTVVWEFLNPHRAGDDGELIAPIYCATVVDPTSVSDWLQ